MESDPGDLPFAFSTAMSGFICLQKTWERDSSKTALCLAYQGVFCTIGSSKVLIHQIKTIKIWARAQQSAWSNSSQILPGFSRTQLLKLQDRIPQHHQSPSPSHREIPSTWPCHGRNQRDSVLSRALRGARHLAVEVSLRLWNVEGQYLATWQGAG